MTDIIQVALLIFGMAAVSYLALNQISGGEGIIKMMNELPDKFDIILIRLINLSMGSHRGAWMKYNQYITQRVNQLAIMFAAFSFNATCCGTVFVLL